MDTLIKLLKQNARLSCKELAAMTDMSEADVEKKIREYEHSGIIKGYSAIIKLFQNDAGFLNRREYENFSILPPLWTE